jgi:hypothetical protein
MSNSLRSKLIRLAASTPELRKDLLTILKEEADPTSHDQNLPETWYGLPPQGPGKTAAALTKKQQMVLKELQRASVNGSYMTPFTAQDANACKALSSLGYAKPVLHQGVVQGYMAVPGKTAMVIPGVHEIKMREVLDPNAKLVFRELGGDIFGAESKPGYYLSYKGILKLLVAAEEQSRAGEAKAIREFNKLMVKLSKTASSGMYTLHTAKGKKQFRSIEALCDYQSEMQGAFATIEWQDDETDEELELDVSDVDFDGTAQCVREVEGMIEELANDSSGYGRTASEQSSLPPGILFDILIDELDESIPHYDDDAFDKGYNILARIITNKMAIPKVIDVYETYRDGKITRENAIAEMVELKAVSTGGRPMIEGYTFRNNVTGSGTFKSVYFLVEFLFDNHPVEGTLTWADPISGKKHDIKLSSAVVDEDDTQRSVMILQEMIRAEMVND